MRIQVNNLPHRREPLIPQDETIFGPRVIGEVREYMAPLGYSITPLHSMGALARSLGMSAVLIKDESARSSLGSFKALGGAYAVIRLVLSEAERRLGREVQVGELNGKEVGKVAGDLTVTCATDGNHGRSVAAGARASGCEAVIFIHSGVSEARAASMRQLGARVLRVSGTYDDSVNESARVAAAEGWQVVSDTAWPGYEETPARVMQGYLIMVDEVLQQCEVYGHQPTHVFLQAGVGGFAAAVAAHWTLRSAGVAPHFIVVEPERAACVFQSAIARKPVRIEPGEPTLMSMLECYEPSVIAWRILERLATAFVTIEESAALCAMLRLARPVSPDPFVMSGESGGAGLAGLMEAVRDSRARAQLGLDQQSVALVFNTEGATDRALYESTLAEAERRRDEDGLSVHHADLR